MPNTQQPLPLLYPGLQLPFLLLVLCFAAWGTAANMTDPLVNVFSRIFNMSMLQSALVQFSYYGAYFCLAIPAAMINARYGYKTGVLCGLGCAVVGALLFYPASQWMTFAAFLSALFILAGGLSILETSANPYVMTMGPEANATRRLNLAQAFNPVGTNIGVFLAATLILPNLHPADSAPRAQMTPEALLQIQQAELAAVMTPYVGMALVLLLIWLALVFKSANTDPLKTSARASHPSGTSRRLWQNRHYRYGVIAQFFNVAAQTCVWTYTIPYALAVSDITDSQAGQYLQYSMLVFLFSRFVMTALMVRFQPNRLLMLMALTGTGLCLFLVMAPGNMALLALILLSACLSLMFPTIYGIALKKLGADTQFGAAGLVMAILGGAIVPLFQAAVIDVYGAVSSFVIPAGCFLVVFAYALFDSRVQQK